MRIGIGGRLSKNTVLRRSGEDCEYSLLLRIMCCMGNRWREDLQEWADAYFVGVLGLQKRKTFGCPSYYLGRKMFAFLYEDSLGCKCDPQEVERLVQAEADVYRHFNPGDGIMRNWLMIARPEAGEYDVDIPRIQQYFQVFRTAGR